MSITNELASLFGRDLPKLSKQIESFPTDELLWQTLPGVINSAGNLTQSVPSASADGIIDPRGPLDPRP